MLANPLDTYRTTNPESDATVGFERAYLLSIVHKGIDETHAAFEYNGKCFQVINQTGNSQAQAMDTECHEHWFVNQKESEPALVKHYCMVVNLPVVKAFAKSLHEFFSSKQKAVVEGRVCEMVSSMPSNCIDEKAINDPTQIRQSYIQSIRILGQWATHQTFYFGPHQFSLFVDEQGSCVVNPSTDIASGGVAEMVKSALNDDTIMAEASNAEYEWGRAWPYQNNRLSFRISATLARFMLTRLQGKNQWLDKSLKLSCKPIPGLRTLNVDKKVHELVGEVLTHYDIGNFKVGLALLDALTGSISEQASKVLRLNELRDHFVFKINNQVKLVRMLKEKVSSLQNTTHRQLSHNARSGIINKDLHDDMIEVRTKKGHDIWQVISKANLCLEADCPLNPTNSSLLAVDDLRAVSIANLAIVTTPQTYTNSTRRGSF